MKHRLLIDSIALLSPHTGIGRYTYEIAKKIQSKDVTFFYGYYSQELLKSSTKKSNINRLHSFIVKYPLFKRVARKIINIGSQLFKPSFDIYWQPNFIPNSGIKAKKIITTVHDFSFILHRDFHPKERIEYFENNFFQNIYRSDFIITGSEFSKREILERLDFDKSKIKVIYHGINHNIFKVKNSNIDIKLPSKFIFSVGSIEPRKNLLGLLKAYNSLDSSIKNEYKLLLAGFKGWENNEIIELINQNRDNIEYLGFISDDELATVYNRASLFIFPSFYEGFGLPILEAMACGTPVISSNSSSMPEVGGDAIIYCNPHSVDDIRDKIKMVLGDKALQEKLISKGLERAKEFSWEKSANEHIRVFESLI